MKEVGRYREREESLARTSTKLSTKPTHFTLPPPSAVPTQHALCTHSLTSSIDTEFADFRGQDTEECPAVVLTALVDKTAHVLLLFLLA